MCGVPRTPPARILAVSYTADLHTHSPYAHGTSKRLTFENLAKWARIKGIDLLASGDFTQPVWAAETRAKLRDLGDGLFEHGGVRFILGTEVNCSAVHAGRRRRVHILVFVPTMEAAERATSAMSTKGKLGWDGRPTLHMTPKELLEMLFGIDERCFIIPAHLWTPYFGLYGSKSGYDSLEECFEDLTDYVPAVETGLSSEPAMNWRVPSLDDVSIMSFSDAHSPENLGRELTVMSGEPSYDGLVAAMKEQAIEYTVEFFPEEGKYHNSGHRKCGVSMSPQDVATLGPQCPVCGRKVTLGVLHRAEELAGREAPAHMGPDGLVRGEAGRPPFRMLVSLRQIIAEALQVGPNTKTVARAYTALIGAIGTEMDILIEAPIHDIERTASERVAHGVARVRRGEVSIEPGFDGRYGSVRVWPEVPPA